MSAALSPDRPLRVIGLMSGTSMDGIDAAYVETDGERIQHLGPDLSLAYTPEFRHALKSFIERAPERTASTEQLSLEATLTGLHVEAVGKLLKVLKRSADHLDLIGFHGQTVWHRPAQRATWQMGDAQRMADATGATIVSDFRRADVAAGGQGAPLVPIFHAALANTLPRPLAVLNIGGVANLTWIGEEDPPSLVAFDTGPGNGLIDDWITRHTGAAMDEGGRIAASGRMDESIVNHMLANGYCAQRPPKSLDRFAFSLAAVDGLSLADGAATLTAFTAACVAHALRFCPIRPRRLLVTGGGRHNATLMSFLAHHTGVAVESVDVHGWRGDAVEAQAFAYLAARSVRGLPITFPGTTGSPRPLTGGTTTRPRRQMAANA